MELHCFHKMEWHFMQIKDLRGKSKSITANFALTLHISSVISGTPKSFKTYQKYVHANS